MKTLKEITNLREWVARQREEYKAKLEAEGLPPERVAMRLEGRDLAAKQFLGALDKIEQEGGLNDKRGV